MRIQEELSSASRFVPREMPVMLQLCMGDLVEVSRDMLFVSKDGEYHIASYRRVVCSAQIVFRADLSLWMVTMTADLADKWQECSAHCPLALLGTIRSGRIT